MSRFFDCSRSTLYRLLDELAEEGYVTKSFERPTVYEAIQPDEVSDLGLEALRRKCQRLETAREQHLKDSRD